VCKEALASTGHRVLDRHGPSACAVGVQRVECRDGGVERAVTRAAADRLAVPATVGQLLGQEPTYGPVDPRVVVTEAGGEKHEHAGDTGLRLLDGHREIEAPAPR
jgi:hypothetical protein